MDYRASGDESCALTAHMKALNILFITLEFRTGTFSGNGVYATAQVRALAAAGHRVLVVSAAPAQARPPPDDFGVAGIHEVPVSSWHRLDAGAPWREFASGVTEPAATAAVAAFSPLDVVLAVDWSALPAARNLAPYCAGAPIVYLNYRVFTRTAVGQDLELVRGLEAAAMAESLLTVALSRSDAEYLEQHVAQAAAAGKAETVAAPPPAAAISGKQPQAATSQPPPPPRPQQQQQQQRGNEPGDERGPTAPAPSERPAASCSTRVRVLLPALREDVRQLEPPAFPELPGSCEKTSSSPSDARCGATAGHEAGAAWAAARPYLSCVVRLSPEKEPERFVGLVEAMAAQGLLRHLLLTPLLLGVANDEYAQGLKARLRAAAPDSVILENFMGPSELAALYRKTRLNFHPSTYDAYGMTIVEAASQGAPSVVHDGGGAVGATDLMRGPEGEVFLMDLTATPEQLTLAVSQLLENPVALAATSARAMRRARSWDEAANAAELVHLVREAMAQRASSGQ